MRVRVSPSWWANSDGQQPKWPVMGADGESPWVPDADFDDSPETPPRLLAVMRNLRERDKRNDAAGLVPATWEYHDDAVALLEAVDAAAAKSGTAGLDVVHRVYGQQLARLQNSRFGPEGEKRVRLATAESALAVLFLAVPGARGWLDEKNGADQ